MASQEKLSRKVDMLNGPVLSRIIIFALPIAASSILQQLFNSVDVAVVGHFAANKAQATAAVGCNSSVINLIVNLFVGISVGANVVVSNYIGQKDSRRAGSAVHTAMTVAIISGFFLLFIGLAVSRPLLELMGTPEDVLPYAVDYLRIYSLGMPVIMIYNFASAILRSIGDTKRPLYCLIISGILNAGLNMFLVIVFHLDVAGVAIATVISNAVSAFLVCYFLVKEKGEAHLDLRKLRIGRADLEKILAIGIPAGIQSMVFSVSNVIIQSVLNGFGTNAVAGSAVAVNFENFSYFFISAFSQTVVTFTSQNFGAGQYRRCIKVFKTSLALSMLSSFIVSWSFILMRHQLCFIFTDSSDVASYAYMRMEIVLCLHFMMSTYEIPGAALRGMGHSMTPAVMTVFGTCVLRLIWAFTVCRICPDFTVLMMIYPISWIITGTAVMSAYLIRRKNAFMHHHARTVASMAG